MERDEEARPGRCRRWMSTSVWRRIGIKNTCTSGGCFRNRVGRCVDRMIGTRCRGEAAGGEGRRAGRETHVGVARRHRVRRSRAMGVLEQTQRFILERGEAQVFGGVREAMLPERESLNFRRVLDAAVAAARLREDIRRRKMTTFDARRACNNQYIQQSFHRARTVVASRVLGLAFACRRLRARLRRLTVCPVIRNRRYRCCPRASSPRVPTRALRSRRTRIALDAPRASRASRARRRRLEKMMTCAASSVEASRVDRRWCPRERHARGRARAALSLAPPVAWRRRGGTRASDLLWQRMFLGTTAHRFTRPSSPSVARTTLSPPSSATRAARALDRRIPRCATLGPSETVYERLGHGEVIARGRAAVGGERTQSARGCLFREFPKDSGSGHAARRSPGRRFRAETASRSPAASSRRSSRMTSSRQCQRHETHPRHGNSMKPKPSRPTSSTRCGSTTATGSHSSPPRCITNFTTVSATNFPSPTPETSKPPR